MADDRPMIVPISHMEMVLLRYGLRAYSAQFQNGARDAEELDSKLEAYWNRHVANQNLPPALVSDG